MGQSAVLSRSLARMSAVPKSRPPHPRKNLDPERLYASSALDQLKLKGGNKNFLLSGDRPLSGDRITELQALSGVNWGRLAEYFFQQSKDLQKLRQDLAKCNIGSLAELRKALSDKRSPLQLYELLIRPEGDPAFLQLLRTKLPQLRPKTINALNGPHLYVRERKKYYAKFRAKNPLDPDVSHARRSRARVQVMFKAGGPNARIKALVLGSTELPSDERMAKIVGTSKIYWNRVVVRGDFPPRDWMVKLKAHMDTKRKMHGEYIQLLEEFYNNASTIRNLRQCFNSGGKKQSLNDLAIVAEMTPENLFLFLRRPADFNEATRAHVVMKLSSRFSGNGEKIREYLDYRFKTTKRNPVATSAKKPA